MFAKVSNNLHFIPGMELTNSYLLKPSPKMVQIIYKVLFWDTTIQTTIFSITQAQIKSQNDRIIEWFGLEEAFEDHPVQLCCPGQNTFH